MKLSEFVRTKAVFEIKVIEGQKSYRPFNAIVNEEYGAAGANIFPLAFRCPLFVSVTSRHAPTRIVQEVIPRTLPEQTGIYFLTDVIDCLHYGERALPREAIADLIAMVESRFEEEGLDLEGRDQPRSRRKAAKQKKALPDSE
jgi:hypothetical protein